MTHLSKRHICQFIHDKIGGKVLEITISKHAHVKFDYHGHECWAVFPISPGDKDWARLKYGDIKRDLKEKGIWNAKTNH